MGELHIDFSIDFLAVGLEPSGLGGEHVIDGAHALLEGQIGDAQVLIGLSQIGLSGLIGLERLLIAESGLADLQGDLLLGIIQFQALDVGLDLSSLDLVAQPAPVPQGHPQGGAHAEGGSKAVLKAIIAVGIGGMHSGDSGQLGHHLAAGDLDLLVIDLSGQFQRAHVMALAIDLIQVVGGRGQSDVQLIVALIGQCHHGVDGQSAQLGQQHARQRHAIVNLGQVNVGLVEFHVNRQLVSQGSDTLVDHRLDVVVEFLHQTDITAREFLLGAQRDDLPIGSIHVIDDVLDLAVEHFLSQLLG